MYQVDRIARARSLEREALRNLVRSSIESPLLGFIGEPHVNVFELNRRLDAVRGRPTR